MHTAITIDALRVLDAIDRRGSFAGAASELFRVPSAISYTVQKLEEDLDVAIFDRTGHRAALTSAGRYLLREGRALLEACLLYTSPSPRDRQKSRMPSSA